MNQDTIEQLWKSYLDAYADIAVADRERLLRQSVTDDIVFSSPALEDQGFANLVEHTSHFQQRFPGAYFKPHRLLFHHGQLLADVGLCNKEGGEFRSAQIFARFNEQGRLTHVTGFF
ncbi:hypothetical protein AAHK20_18730 [Trinickia sp. YCB016]